MAENVTPSEAKAIAERHLRSLGFLVTASGGSSRMHIAATGLVAKITVRAAPVSRSELVNFHMNREVGPFDARAFFALNGYGPTAVDYATSHRIQLFDIDRAGRVTERNKVGLQAPNKSASPSSRLSTPSESHRDRPSDPRGQVMRAWESPEAEQVRKLLLATAKAIVAAISNWFSKPAGSVPQRKASDNPANRHANRGLMAVGAVMFVVVVGSVLAAVGRPDTDRPAGPAPSVSMTTVRELSSAITPQKITRSDTQAPTKVESSSAIATTTIFRPPPPVLTPSRTRTYLPPSPVNTPEYTPPPSPSASWAYYKNCDAARAAGAAPLLRGQAGYRSELDADDDGIACEWS
ncbi:excalibur calcium-binding domain-containing protein [Rhodococcus pyridinivorans]|uniref:excalibur calcium-binding domain-containing protein n=1 Tax=Rhodococcus pyridinivorans TaxID=103816 RepID=UPI000AC31477|nr:excalibur calcium-binding domain-containing protein [Rhodococcus pyridinivorans]